MISRYHPPRTRSLCPTDRLYQVDASVVFCLLDQTLGLPLALTLVEFLLYCTRIRECGPCRSLLNSNRLPVCLLEIQYPIPRLLLLQCYVYGRRATIPSKSTSHDNDTTTVFSSAITFDIIFFFTFFKLPGPTLKIDRTTYGYRTS